MVNFLGEIGNRKMSTCVCAYPGQVDERSWVFNTNILRSFE